MNYPKLYWYLVKYNINRELQFRTDFWLSVLYRLVFFLMTIFFYRILYNQTLAINGWTLYEALVLVAVFQFIESLLYTLFISNFSQMPNYISEGELDFLLLKPVDTQFFTSLRYFSLASAFNLVPPIILFAIAAVKLHLAFHFSEIGLFVLLLILSTIILYSLWFLTVISLFWLTKIFQIQEFFLSLFRFMQYPSSVYQGGIRIFFSFVFPIIFTIALPVQVLLGKVFNIRAILWLALAAVITFVIARVVWRLGLKNYSSASS